MGDRSLRGRGILGRTGPEGGGPKGGGIGTPLHPEPKKSKRKAGPGPKQTRQRIKTFEEEVNASDIESLGVSASGGYQGKPHSTKRGREMAGRRELDRFFYGRKKKEPKGTKV